MKNNKALRMLAFSLAALLTLMNLFTLAPLAVNGVATKWSFSEDQEYLTNETDSVKYKYFFNGVAIRPDAQSVFVYNQSLDYDDFMYTSVYTNPYNPGAVWIDYYDNYEIFVTDEALPSLIDFTEGKTGNYFLEKNTGERAKIDKELVAKLDKNLENGIDVKSFDVRYIKPSGTRSVYNVIVQDESETFAYTYGAIYSMYDGLWYVNYMNLDNSFFDANGNFSYYRGGIVQMTKLNQEYDTYIKKCKDNFTPYEVYYDYERVIFEGVDDDIFGDASEVTVRSITVGIFWIVYFLIIVLPAVLILIVCCILPFSKKTGKAKYWLIVAGLAAVWLIAALVHAGILIFLPLP